MDEQKFAEVFSRAVGQVLSEAEQRKKKLVIQYGGEGKAIPLNDIYYIVGIINLDYRSLVHHFENGVWIYQHEVLKQIKVDLADTMEKSIEMGEGSVKDTLLQRLIRVLVRVLSPLL